MAGVAGLVQRRGEDLGRDAVELGVELERGDELLGAGDLEVHVAEGVLGAEDVGQRDVLRLAVDLTGDQAHRDARDGARAAAHRPAAATCVEAQTEPIEVEPLEPMASES